jgi:hypothetical protein
MSSVRPERRSVSCRVEGSKLVEVRIGFDAATSSRRSARTDREDGRSWPEWAGVSMSSVRPERRSVSCRVEGSKLVEVRIGFDSATSSRRSARTDREEWPEWAGASMSSVRPERRSASCRVERSKLVEVRILLRLCDFVATLSTNGQKGGSRHAAPHRRIHRESQTRG